MTNILLIVILLFLFVVLINTTNKSCNKYEGFNYKANTSPSSSSSTSTVNKKPKTKRPVPKRPVPKTVNSSTSSANSILAKKLNECVTKFNSQPIVVNENGLSDKTIKNIYKIFCDKFGKPGGLQIDDNMRQLTPEALIEDAQAYASSSDITLRGMCNINPQMSQVTDDSAINNIYKFFCDNEELKANEVNRNLTAKNIWEGAQFLANSSNEDDKRACYKNPTSLDVTREGTVKNIYRLYCDNEELGGNLLDKTQSIPTLFETAKSWAITSDSDRIRSCYKLKNKDGMYDSDIDLNINRRIR